MIHIIFLILVLTIGFLAKIPRDRVFNLTKSFFLVFVQTTIGSILFTVALSFLNDSKMMNSLGSLFSLLITIAVINGIIIYWINRWAFKVLKINDQVVTLCEYIIQWSLIYITVYQVVFDTIFPKEALQNINIEDLGTPTDLMILVLPSLISVWISVILYKIHKNSL